MTSRFAARNRLEQNLAARRMPGLDGLRAVAVFLVIAYHAGIPGVPGGHGVLLFFVLSGFLITRLLILEEAKMGSVSLSSFYARRTLRIFPAFYAYAAIALLLLIAAHKTIPWRQVTASLLYFNNYYQGIYGDPNTLFSHTWSLAVEEQFYILWPGLFLLFASTRNRLKACAGLIVCVWILRAIRVTLLHTPDGYIYEAFDTRADSLLAGCALALLVATPAGLRWIERLLYARWKLVLTLGLICLSVALQSFLPLWYREAVAFSIDPLLMAALILQTIAFASTAGVSWLEWHWVRYLGRISYPLYLYQQLVIGTLEKRLHSLPIPLTLAVVTAICVLAASASYFLIEKPALRLKHRFERVATPGNLT